VCPPDIRQRQADPCATSARPSRSARATLRRNLIVKAGIADRLPDILGGILKISSEAIVVADEKQRILIFSKGAEEIFGYKQDELLGQRLERLMPSEFRKGHRDHVQRFASGAVQSRRMKLRAEVLGQRKSGEIFPLEAGLSKMSTPGGLIYTVILRDVSARRAAEDAMAHAVAQAEAASQAKSAFLAAMSHEIRTPLNGVLGMAQSMAMEDLSPHQRERLSVIHQSGESLLAILNDILDLSKIESGKLQLEDAEFDLGELAHGVHATFQAIAERSGLDFDLHISASARGVYRGDPLRVRQILCNLVSNALKFTANGGVKIEARRRSGLLTLSVQDTGIGIAPEKIGQLFRKFEQADASTTRQYGGTGLGLAICYDLAQMMGGSIAVDSPAGRGATFLVALPLSKLSGRSAPADHPEHRVSRQWAPIRILAAEDNGTNQLVLRTLLNQAGLEVRIVADGMEAVAAWAEKSWDLILMDIQMPKMDGLTATGVIRSREAAEGRRRTPILALTANAMDHEVAEYKRCGMDGYVAKPIELQKLYAAIEEAVQT
jgi:PAS domain S-box-containing protein